MSRYMFDGCDENALPPGLSAGYGDGICRWVKKKPNVLISSTGQIVALVLDVEPGNPNAVQSVDWIIRSRAAGYDVWTYTAEWAPGYRKADINAACDARGVRRPWMWLSGGQTDSLSDDPQDVAWQFGFYGGYDQSRVRDFLPGVDGAAGGDGDMTGEEHAALFDANQRTIWINAATDETKYAAARIEAALQKLTDTDPAQLAQAVLAALPLDVLAAAIAAKVPDADAQAIAAEVVADLGEKLGAQQPPA